MQHAAMAELPNDVVAIGEEAASAFMRGTTKLKEQIEPMALGLAEARRRYPSDPLFGAWLKASRYADLNKDDRAALIRLGENWDDDLAARFAELDSYSPRLIVQVLLDGGPPDCTRGTTSCLYRHFDRCNRLLYVGVSLKAIRRLMDHRDHAHWFDQIVRVEIEQFSTREDALAA